jgi:nicotinamide-nucleotide amidase
MDTDEALTALSKKVSEHLLANQRRLAIAESCTGGFIAKVITDIAGSSQWFEEGFVTYGNESKVRRLGVPRSILEADGAVSEAVVRAMAVGALERSDADVAVAVSGIAGPGGAVAGKPVGTVWLAWAHRHGQSLRVSARLKFFKGDRDAVRRKTVRLALEGLLQQ